jgi:ATP-binding cassette subfamily B protein
MAAPKRPMGKGRMPINKESFKVLPKLVKYLFHYYKLPLIVIFVCVIFAAIAGSFNSFFLKTVIDTVITPGLTQGFDAVLPQLKKIITLMIVVFGLGIISSFTYNQIMVGVTQGFLNKVRKDMFVKMEKLPIKYFDRNPHGDIMSRYTNDVDSLRQFVSQTLISFISTIVTIVYLIFMMLNFSLWLTLFVIVGVVFITILTGKIGGNSAKYFMKQQQSIGALEGFVEEIMNGQKVVKVFNHEEETKKDFVKLNNGLCEDATKANFFANILGPILNNVGNILYIIIIIIGSIFAIKEVFNPSLEVLFNRIQINWFHKEIEPIKPVLTAGIVASFLGMTKNFINQINNVSHQLGMISMAMAGADRVFKLLDETEEVDDGYVTLVNAKYDENGNLVETNERTHIWAWKHPHKADGTITYTELKGDIVLHEVDFGYFEDKLVLHDIDVYAHPGEQIAFVGATGAGKTTITNLINRFYDIADGKIRYDGININKIKKADLRRSLGIVLQDTNLFTGTVMENIRYGRLDATDEEVYEAAKIANAYDFITRLPEGFNTMLTHDGSNLSQGQRQLLSIARAACADAPVMILDEATSSIDTRTEALVQKGMDALMEGRTVFVIAHRLSTVRNSDCIMVLSHGRIIERGTHDELLEEKGTYYQLYTGAFELE